MRVAIGHDVQPVVAGQHVGVDPIRVHRQSHCTRGKRERAELGGRIRIDETQALRRFVRHHQHAGRRRSGGSARTGARQREQRRTAGQLERLHPLATGVHAAGTPAESSDRQANAAAAIQRDTTGGRREYPAGSHRPNALLMMPPFMPLSSAR